MDGSMVTRQDFVDLYDTINRLTIRKYAYIVNDKFILHKYNTVSDRFHFTGPTLPPTVRDGRLINRSRADAHN